VLKFRLSAKDRNQSQQSGDVSDEKVFILHTFYSWKTKLTLEILQLRRQLDNNPEVTRYAYENMRLREKIQRYEATNALLESKSAELDSHTHFEQSLISKILELEGLKSDEKRACLIEQGVQTDSMETEHQAVSAKFATFIPSLVKRWNEMESLVGFWRKKMTVATSSQNKFNF
jgi:hypothetical protein